MSKNRTRSPTTGLRRLANDPLAASSIRQVLTKLLQQTEADVAGEFAYIRVISSPELRYTFAKTELRITPAQIETFAYELVTKDILRDVTRHSDGSFMFFPSKQGWTFIRAGSRKVSEAPKKIFSPDVKTRQRPLERDKIARTSIVNIAVQSKPEPDQAFNTLPTARELLEPLLKISEIGLVKKNLVDKQLAEAVGFVKRHMYTALPAGTNQTFHNRAQHAVAYLVKRGLIHRTKKTLSLTTPGRKFLASPKWDWPGFEELPVRTVTPPGPRIISGAASPGLKIDLTRVLLTIGSMEPFDLISMWENAKRILDDPRKKDQHEKVTMAIRAIEAEWARRNASGNPEEYFDWPTTEARGGDGSLTLENVQKSGVLGQLDYHVGRALGQPDPYRRRTLMKIFEQSIPLSLKGFEPKEWGEPGSATRLRKMAYSIAAFTRSAKRKKLTSFEEAIRQWETDLKYLYDQFYVGKFGFAWPSTQVT